MADIENILISLESRHAKNIYSGEKKIELRRRTMHVTPGTTVWIYEKSTYRFNYWESNNHCSAHRITGAAMASIRFSIWFVED